MLGICLAEVYDGVDFGRRALGVDLVQRRNVERHHPEDRASALTPRRILGLDICCLSSALALHSGSGCSIARTDGFFSSEVLERLTSREALHMYIEVGLLNEAREFRVVPERVSLGLANHLG